MKTKTYKRLLVISAVSLFALFLSACGSDEKTTETSSTPPEPVAQIDQLNGVDTKVTLDQGFVEAITSLGLKPNVVGNGQFVDGGAAVAFPITAGTVTYYDPASSYRPYVQGVIEHNGSGLSLASKKIKVELTNFTIDPGTSELFGDVSANGKEVVSQAKLFDLDGSTLQPLAVDEKNNTATLEGTKVLLSDEAAALLNETFSTDALAGGFEIGISKITVTL